MSNSYRGVEYLKVIYLYDCGHYSNKPELMSRRMYDINMDTLKLSTLPGICYTCVRKNEFDDKLIAYVRIVDIMDPKQAERDKKLKELGI